MKKQLCPGCGREVQLMSKAAPSRVSKALPKVLTVLNEWSTATEVCRAVGTWDGDSAVQNALTRLAKLGMIERVLESTTSRRRYKYRALAHVPSETKQILARYRTQAERAK